MPFDLTNKNIKDTYQNLLQKTGSDGHLYDLVGNKVRNDAIDLDYKLETNIKNLADCKNKNISEITACILDRPRHKQILDELKK